MAYRLLPAIDQGTLRTKEPHIMTTLLKKLLYTQKCSNRVSHKELSNMAIAEADAFVRVHG
jgi:hypothetical protein